MQIQEMRAYIRSVVEIDSGDISDDVLNRFWERAMTKWFTARSVGLGMKLQELF